MALAFTLIREVLVGYERRTAVEHEAFMRAAIEEALSSKTEGGQPFGSVLVKDNEIVARAHNHVNRDGDPTSHAELNLLQDFFREKRVSDLSGYVLYASFEPCAMCAGAIAWFNVSTVVFGADRHDVRSTYPQLADPVTCDEVVRRSGSDTTVVPHVLRSECAAVFG